MIVRISFVANQRIQSNELEVLNNTLSDVVDAEPLFYDSDSKLTQFYSWKHVLDSSEITEDDKKTLVKRSDFFELSSNKEYLADLELFVSNHPQIKINIRGYLKTVERNVENLIGGFKEMAEKFENILNKFDKSVEFNEKCDVHVPNLGVLSINQVGYLEDGCTEKMQEIINLGWRLLAVCPQPQRRPDYIFGRTSYPLEEKFECVRF